MYLGRYYLERKKWIAAINRFKTIIEDYDTTVYVEEALHRLVEVHYTIGLEGEAQKYAKVLGYNYESSNGMKIHMLFLIVNIKKREKRKQKNLY